MDIGATEMELSVIERLHEEGLEEARSIQSLMLPTDALHAGLIEICHGFQPVAAVGGDFLDYFELPDGTIGLYLGDVSGKGLPAALYAALAVGTLRGIHKTGQSPAAVMSMFNRRLMMRGVPKRYAAMQYAVYDPGRGRCVSRARVCQGRVTFRWGEPAYWRFRGYRLGCLIQP
jgi:sigma-B regulation protein RsbU (phosphoserine phosphatase)